jgi:ATP-dependent DNA helicase RecQ
MVDIHAILKNYWGYDSFRPLQEDIIYSVLNGKDTLALLPTGGGKSICFQVPAMAMDGLCLVISPLIALMKDQVQNLHRKNITAFAIYSGMSRQDLITTLKIAGSSNCKFLYVSPERLETKLFKEYLPALNIKLIAVDEAHCISQWGYDFRPPYLRIAALRDELPDVPILALTASATSVVHKDICDRLQFKSSNVFRQSFERPNLSYSVFQADSKVNRILEILQKVPGCSIVYCKSRRRTREISELLNLNGIKSDFYHAGLAQNDRNQRQENWIKNHTRTIVCTNAFGMGIDKPDVRLVLHADVPESTENYYQEAGRAGRDGKKAYAVLLYDDRAMEDLKKLAGIRFPSLAEIQLVYQALMNYLQIPSGGGEGIYYDFDINDFVKKFKLESQLVIYSIKAMEQEGWLAFNESVFIPSKAHFVTDKEWLYQFETIYPALEPLVKALLRTYEGIFDQPTNINEKALAGLLRKEEQDITGDLKRLQGYKIIEYEPMKDTPQLYLLMDRVRAEDLKIKGSDFEKRKKHYIERINSQLKYVYEKEECRSQYLASYFGDNSTRPCGICDNCLNRKKKEVAGTEFEQIHQLIIAAVSAQSLVAKELLQKLPDIGKEKLWEVLEFLQAENKIQINDRGEVMAMVRR